jgi:hypothetical protein
VNIWLSTGSTDGTAVEHTTRDVLFGGEVIAFALQASVDVVDVAQIVTPLGGRRPRLYQLEHLVLDVVIGGDVRGGLEQRRQVIEELAGSDLLDKVRAAILDTCVGELPSLSVAARTI